MHIEDIPLDRIQIRERTRTEIRNIDSLADSIRQRTLLQPIVVRRDGSQYVLVAGGRRIEAVRSLGRVKIEAHVAETLNDELDALLAEGEENTEREPFTPSEAVAHAERIETIEKARAAERRLAGQRAGGPKAAKARTAPGPGVLALDFVEPEPRAEPLTLAGKFPASVAAIPDAPRRAPDVRTRDLVAKATGMSGRTLEKAKHVVATAKDPDVPEAVREEARAAVAQMDRTGKVDPAYRKVRDTEAALADAPMDDALAQDAALKQAKLRLAITKSTIQVRDSLPLLSAEHCAEAMEADQWEDILRAYEVLGDWIDEVRTLRKRNSPLRLVK